MQREVVTDAELACRARGGDAQALAALLQRCRPSLYAIAIRMLGNRADAADAVQDTCLVALARVGELREDSAARAWLHAVIRNLCLMRIRARREVPCDRVELPGAAPGPEEILERHVMREWVWHSLDALSPDERITLVLRYFTRCTSYEDIARVTSVPVGTVRSRLNRARSRLADALLARAADTPPDHAELQASRCEQWEQFYTTLHHRPVPRTYRDLFDTEVQVRDTVGHWAGIDAWSAHERQAITVGVRATITGLLATRDLTVLEIDFTNPAAAPDHCPAQATFVHRLTAGRSSRLQIHYPQPRAHPQAST